MRLQVLLNEKGEKLRSAYLTVIIQVCPFNKFPHLGRFFSAADLKPAFFKFFNTQRTAFILVQPIEHYIQRDTAAIKMAYIIDLWYIHADYFLCVCARACVCGLEGMAEWVERPSPIFGDWGIRTSQI